MFMRAFYGGLNQADEIFSSNVIILPKNTKITEKLNFA